QPRLDIWFANQIARKSGFFSGANVPGETGSGSNGTVLHIYNESFVSICSVSQRPCAIYDVGWIRVAFAFERVQTSPEQFKLSLAP
ncbi:hypothetical protein, partial [Phyllobacterium endophyticum]|uniref:hypothetical protein n=1 Tax=Phyllobacterium endophyticum TaxID=1149773 RepID=UPI001FEE43D0